MKKMLALSAVVVLSTGCVSSLAKLAKELKNDPAIVSISIGSPWGTQTLTRIGGQTNNGVVVDPPKVSLTPK